MPQWSLASDTCCTEADCDFASEPTELSRVSQMPILSPSFWHYFHFVVQIGFACGGQILAAWNDWFDAKDIQSVASNYIVLEPTAMDGQLFSTNSRRTTVIGVRMGEIV